MDATAAVGISPASRFINDSDSDSGFGDNTLIGEVRWLPELSAKRRLEGDYIWAKLVYQF